MQSSHKWAWTHGEPNKPHQLIEEPDKFFDAESYPTVPPPQNPQPTPPLLRRITTISAAAKADAGAETSESSTERCLLVCFGVSAYRRALGSRGGPRVRPHPECEYPVCLRLRRFTSPITNCLDLS